MKTHGWRSVPGTIVVFGIVVGHIARLELRARIRKVTRALREAAQAIGVTEQIRSEPHR